MLALPLQGMCWTCGGMGAGMLVVWVVAIVAVVAIVWMVTQRNRP